MARFGGEHPIGGIPGTTTVLAPCLITSSVAVEMVFTTSGTKDLICDRFLPKMEKL